MEPVWLLIAFGGFVVGILFAILVVVASRENVRYQTTQEKGPPEQGMEQATPAKAAPQ